jgi:hypothetical protein
MANETGQAPKKDRFQQEFEALPLEEKIKKLLRLEAVTLTEAFNYGVNESMKAADRLGDVLSDFGKKVESEFKKATSERCGPSGTAAPNASEPRPAQRAGPAKAKPPRKKPKQ